MPYQSKTYSLSNEVIEAIQAARQHGESPNQFLRRLILGVEHDGFGNAVARTTKKHQAADIKTKKESQ